MPDPHAAPLPRGTALDVLQTLSVKPQPKPTPEAAMALAAVEVLRAFIEGSLNRQ